MKVDMSKPFGVVFVDVHRGSCWGGGIAMLPCNGSDQLITVLRAFFAGMAGAGMARTGDIWEEVYTALMMGKEWRGEMRCRVHELKVYLVQGGGDS